MSFYDSFRKDRPNKMLQRTPSRLVAAFTRTSGLASALIARLSVSDGRRLGRAQQRSALLIGTPSPAGHANL
jgi:hypothetical protein